VIDALTEMGKFKRLASAMRVIPLVTPVDGGEITSAFGDRIDPFNERLAFHSGLDFSGTKGADVHVTAPGIVVFAGPRGAYGNAVEVDHGFGIRTRYGHLSKIMVQLGAHLEKGAVVGALGSTGRSTGPHVHYEVWYGNAVRDPSKFIKAGHYVLEN
jgi:murein DD-endopeptidase MepM/ murein hydrolase activator NlpD